MKTNNRIKSSILLILVPILVFCTFQGKKNDATKQLKDGSSIVRHIDHLLDSLHQIEKDSRDSEELIITINENIRQAIEHNLNHPDILNEIGGQFRKKKHRFTFIQSSDEQFAILTWLTKRNDFPIKNIAFYTIKNKVVPTSLFGIPLLYDQIQVIENDMATPTYLLGGYEYTRDTLKNRYQLSAYTIQKDGIQENRIFPNGESAITVRCASRDTLDCLPIHIGSETSNGNLHGALALQSLSYVDGEYILD